MSNLTTLPASAFVAWLATKPTEAIVGTAHNSACCPLATWLRETTGQQVYVRVHDIATEQYAPYDWRNNLPEWMQAFIDEVDGPDIFGEDGPFINTATALEIMERITRLEAQS